MRFACSGVVAVVLFGGCFRDVALQRTHLVALPQSRAIAIAPGVTPSDVSLGPVGSVVFWENTSPSTASVVVRSLGDDPTTAPATLGFEYDAEHELASSGPIPPGGFASLRLSEPGRYPYELWIGTERIASGSIDVVAEDAR